MIIRILFIAATTLLTNSLLASSINTSWGHDLPDFYATLSPITTPELSVGNADSQTNSSKEYHTFEPGEQPPITVWTQFPGAKSNVDKPTVFTSQTATQLALQHLVATHYIFFNSIEINRRKI